MQLVIAAITTEPSLQLDLLAVELGLCATCRCGRSAVATWARSGSIVCGPASWNEPGSLAGKLSATLLSIVPLP